MGKEGENGIEKSKVLIYSEIAGYVPHAVAARSILNKLTGKISVIAFDCGESSPVKTIPFDTFVQIIDGNAEIVIDGLSHSLDSGQCIIIPAHSSKIFRANKRFKMISTIIKSGYED